MMNNLAILVIAVVSAWTSGVGALWCYESDLDTGRLRARDCPKCSYCVIASTGLGEFSSTVFGMESEAEDLSVYTPIFEQGRDTNWAYKVMSTCVLERYIIGATEYFFRCFCNTDFCNKADDISSFISNTVNRDLLMEENRVK